MWVKGDALLLTIYLCTGLVLTMYWTRVRVTHNTARLSRMVDGDSCDGAGGAGSGSSPPPVAPRGPRTFPLGTVPAAPVDPPAGARASNPIAAPAGHPSPLTSYSPQESATIRQLHDQMSTLL
jgi:hypothetical protein